MVACMVGERRKVLQTCGTKSVSVFCVDDYFAGVRYFNGCFDTRLRRHHVSTDVWFYGCYGTQRHISTSSDDGCIKAICTRSCNGCVDQHTMLFIFDGESHPDGHHHMEVSWCIHSNYGCDVTWLIARLISIGKKAVWRILNR